MRKTMAGVCLAIAGVLAAAPSWAALLGNPGNGRLYSGIGVISGWKCEADGELTIVFNDDGKHIPLVYGTERTDVRKHGQCQHIDHDNVGFVAIWNWAALGDGEHEAVAYDNGVAFDRATFTVGSTGEEFLKGAMRQQLVENFPAPGETTILEWNESTQHLVGEGTPWSFSVIEDKRDIWGNQYPYFENASISVVRTSDDVSLVITNPYTDSEGFGVPNLLSWQVEGWEYDTLYEVEISNVTLQSGETRSYSYPVFIDRANIEY